MFVRNIILSIFLAFCTSLVNAENLSIVSAWDHTQRLCKCDHKEGVSRNIIWRPEWLHNLDELDKSIGSLLEEARPSTKVICSKGLLDKVPRTSFAHADLTVKRYWDILARFGESYGVETILVVELESDKDGLDVLLTYVEVADLKSRSWPQLTQISLIEGLHSERTGFKHCAECGGLITRNLFSEEVQQRIVEALELALLDHNNKKR